MQPAHERKRRANLRADALRACRRVSAEPRVELVRAHRACVAVVINRAHEPVHSRGRQRAPVTLLVVVRVVDRDAQLRAQRVDELFGRRLVTHRRDERSCVRPRRRKRRVQRDVGALNGRVRRMSGQRLGFGVAVRSALVAADSTVFIVVRAVVVHLHGQ